MGFLRLKGSQTQVTYKTRHKSLDRSLISTTKSDYTMSTTTQTTKTPTTTRRTSITWDSKVKQPRAGGPIWGADKVPRKEREPSPETYDEDEEEERRCKNTSGWTGGGAEKSTPTLSDIDRTSAMGEIERVKSTGGTSTSGR
jgi:hypothetical protein